jgi:hypothetical protein
MLSYWKIDKTRLDYWEFIKIKIGILFLNQMGLNLMLKQFKLHANN